MITLAFIRLSEELILSFLKGSLGTFWRHLGRLLGFCGGPECNGPKKGNVPAKERFHVRGRNCLGSYEDLISV